MTGQLLGHYRVLEQIGSGGMGEVYRARDERLGRDVALKLIRPSSAKDPDRVRRFEHEARAAAALNHPNIVAIYDIGVHEGMPFIVSELLEGKTLRDRLAGGLLSVREASDYGLEIAEGLMAAHDKHIIHRDLKPENLFITKDNRIKILDFGIAKLVHPETEKTPAIQSLTTQTRSGSVLGTVAYMSPEQLRGKPVDARSDIFSLGTILYEMLTGRRAFRGETDVDTITAVLRETPPEVTRERTNVPKAFEQIVNHCLEKEPEKRFQSVRDLIFALETLGARSAPKFGWWLTAAPVRRVMLALLGFAVLIGAGWLLRSWIPFAASNPEYHRLTFERGTVYGARFTPDRGSVVYEASWHGDPPRLFSTVSTSPQAQVLEVSDAHLPGLLLLAGHRANCWRTFAGRTGTQPRKMNWRWFITRTDAAGWSSPSAGFSMRVPALLRTSVSRRPETKSHSWITLCSGTIAASCAWSIGQDTSLLSRPNGNRKAVWRGVQREMKSGSPPPQPDTTASSWRSASAGARDSCWPRLTA